jgi:hypothetical protein
MRLNGGRRWGMLHPWKKFTADVPRQGSPPFALSLVGAQGGLRYAEAPASATETGQFLLVFLAQGMWFYLMVAVTIMDKGEWFFAAGAGYLPAGFSLDRCGWLELPGERLFPIDRLRCRAVLVLPPALHTLDVDFCLSLRQRRNQLGQSVHFLISSSFGDDAAGH